MAITKQTVIKRGRKHYLVSTTPGNYWIARKEYETTVAECDVNGRVSKNKYDNAGYHNELAEAVAHHDDMVQNFVPKKK